MIINIESCEKYISNQQQVYEQPKVAQPMFKEPIDYSKFDLPKQDESTEDEERIFVDISEESSDNVVSITDLLLGQTNKEDE